ncbi:MAG: chemotaxis protein CheW [Lachnospiraceae bacterium]|nr:chemotaxis protein CheW [Lachnospiraceae bacterium]MBQ3905341.1 chemotaxis protein CheW [Lachnospiraceae bacterium]
MDAVPEKKKEEQVEKSQYIVIQLGSEQYGIDVRYVDNIVRMQKITRVPKMPKYLVGIINLRGEVLPVMSLRLKMGLERDVYEKKTRIIVLKTQSEGNLGVIVDEVKEVVTLESKQVDKVDDLKLEGKTYVSGVGKRENGDIISLLDLSVITLEENA